jgi:hypothetical protein
MISNNETPLTFSMPKTPPSIRSTGSPRTPRLRGRYTSSKKNGSPKTPRLRGRYTSSKKNGSPKTPRLRGSYTSSKNTGSPKTPINLPRTPGSPTNIGIVRNNRSNTKTNFNKKFNESKIELNYLPNNSNSVGNPLTELLTPTGRLNLYRAGTIARNNSSKIYDIGISFYGTSRRALQSYNNSTNVGKKQYYRMVLSAADTSKIVDLHLLENTKKILDFLSSTRSTEYMLIIKETLFHNYDERAPKIVRHSEKVEKDIEMAKILMRIFPDSIGIYTRADLMHTHNEVIIWNKDINEQLQRVNVKKRGAQNMKNKNGTHNLNTRKKRKKVEV